MATSKKQRLKFKRARRKSIFNAQNGLCFYCDKPMSYGDHGKMWMTLDHFIPKSIGGRNSRANLVGSCSKCNLLKADRFPTDEEWSKYRKLKGPHCVSYKKSKCLLKKRIQECGPSLNT